jgi:hypothetical protein
MILLFGNDGANAGSGAPCLTYANVANGNACLTTGFSSGNQNLVFGPVPGPPGSTMTLSQLAASTNGTATGQTITVLDNGVATTLTCQNTSGSTCNDNVHTPTIQAGHFLQVSVTGGTGSPWKVTFRLG